MISFEDLLEQDPSGFLLSKFWFWDFEILRTFFFYHIVSSFYDRLVSFPTPGENVNFSMPEYEVIPDENDGEKGDIDPLSLPLDNTRYWMPVSLLPYNNC